MLLILVTPTARVRRLRTAYLSYFISLDTCSRAGTALLLAGQDRETPHVHEGELHRDPVESHLRLSPTEVHPELEHPLATAGVQVPAPMPAAPGVPPAPAPMRLMPAPTDLHPDDRPASTLLADRERQHDRVRLPLPHVLQCQDCWAHQRHSQRERRAGLGAGPGVGTALQPCRGRHSLTAVQGQAQPCRRSRQSRNIIFKFLKCTTDEQGCACLSVVHFKK